MATIWLGVILLSLLTYILLDGYDLGVGIASLFERNKERRRNLIEMVANGWDGNETWLIMTGVALWGGFPLIFGTVLPHLYTPLILMLFGLIFRGVSIEVISQTGKKDGFWYWAFGVGSLVTAFMQGVALGAITIAVPLTTLNAFEGSTASVFTPFTLLAGLTVALAYVALGYAYLRYKLMGASHALAGKNGLSAAVLAVIGTLFLLLIINTTDAPLNLGSGWRVASWLMLLIVVAIGALIAVYGFTRKRASLAVDRLPFIGLSIAVVAFFLSLVVTHYPILVPPLTVDTARSGTNSYWMLLIGVGVFIPLVVFFNIYSHYVFRGRSSSASVAPVDRSKVKEVERKGTES